MAALVGGLLIANKGTCPSEYEDCIEYLLTTMHDNYNGYSASISSVHEYATDYEIAERDSGWDEDGDSGDEGGGSTGGGATTQPEAPVTQTTMLTANGGMSNLGEYDPSSGLVTQNGEVVGSYNPSTGTYESSDGTVINNVNSNDVVVDEDGNILQREAVTDCGDPAQVYGFGYRSEANGDFYDSLQFSEMDVADYCTEATYKVVARDLSEDGGRIVDGYYYAVSTTPASYIDSGPKQPDGEVVYFEQVGTSGQDASVCVVMAAGWDSGIDTEDLSDEEVYAEQLALLYEPNEEESTWIGSLDNEYYVEQVYLNGESASENDCPASRVITAL
ncbi:hypothetical protein [uncultured Gilvimarinus sp.]|uniref:hypothetical protein n=1 Tax=uncultured Gilvimarinus sp. TaxID=1689143 RepID=UPI0030DBE1ED